MAEHKYDWRRRLGHGTPGHYAGPRNQLDSTRQHRVSSHQPATQHTRGPELPSCTAAGCSPAKQKKKQTAAERYSSLISGTVYIVVGGGSGTFLPEGRVRDCTTRIMAVNNIVFKRYKFDMILVKYITRHKNSSRVVHCSLFKQH